ncbi:MAG: hypothetical protein DMG75_06755 [Acidobacteria bacterium]|nr:MAG: hypothetical protein DMG75_06755 [Acidobacteriota bacterium]
MLHRELGAKVTAQQVCANITGLQVAVDELVLPVKGTNDSTRLREHDTTLRRKGCTATFWYRSAPERSMFPAGRDESVISALKSCM